MAKLCDAARVPEANAAAFEAVVAFLEGVSSVRLIASLPGQPD
jgi:hypothetical protein